MYNTIYLFLNMGTPEIMLIMFAVLLLFGGKKLPELARGLGKGIREFKDASDGVKREIHKNINSVNEGLEIDVNAPVTNTSTDHADQTSANNEHDLDIDVNAPKADTDEPELSNTDQKHTQTS